MVVVRLIFMLAVLAIGASVVLYLIKRERKYLDFAWRLGKVVVALLLVFFALMAIERLV